MPNAGESMKHLKLKQEDENGKWTPGMYRLKYPLRLRKGAGLNYSSVPKKSLGKKTADCVNLDGTVRAGTTVEVTQIRHLSVSVWGKTKEGWLCLYMSHTPYVVKM